MIHEGFGRRNRATVNEKGARLPRDERGGKGRASVHLIRLVPNVVPAVDYVAAEVQATFQNQADFMRLRNPTEKACLV